MSALLALVLGLVLGAMLTTGVVVSLTGALVNDLARRAHDEADAYLRRAPRAPFDRERAT